MFISCHRCNTYISITNHRIIEWFNLEGTLKIIECNRYIWLLFPRLPERVRLRAAPHHPPALPSPWFWLELQGCILSRPAASSCAALGVGCGFLCCPCCVSQRGPASLWKRWADVISASARTWGQGSPQTLSHVAGRARSLWLDVSGSAFGRRSDLGREPRS